MNGSGKILFSEVQRFSIFLIAPLGILFLVAFFLEGHMIFRVAMETEGHRPVWALPVSIAGIALNVFITIVLISSKLQTRLETTALYIRFFPFHLTYKKIDFDDIITAYPRTYQPFAEFGGWGIHWTSKGRVYNVSGNRGVQLELKNDNKVLIGSRHADEFAGLLQEAMFHSRLSPYAAEETEEQTEEGAEMDSADTSLGQKI